MKLYRAMTADADGRPVVGPSARGLGVRAAGFAPHNDVDAALPGDAVPPGKGMSVAPDDPLHLADHRRPPELGGTGRDPVWVIDESDLGPDLAVHPDSATHAMIGTARPMNLDELERALVGTRAKWVRFAG